MNVEVILALLKQLFITTVSIAAPVLLAGMVVGLLVSVFQAVTSVNEQTMTMVPKMLVVAGVLLYTMPWMIRTVMDFAQPLFGNLSQYVR